MLNFIKRKINLKTVDSTSSYLLKNRLRFFNLTFVSAEYQTQGKGREKRIWQSERNKNLLFSVLIKDKKLTDKFYQLSLCSAVAVIRVLEKYGVKNCTLKWPNDVYSNGKKICGILLNGKTQDKNPYVIVGIGINVNQKDFNGEYKRPPTSVFNETNMITDIKKIKKDVFKELTKTFKKVKNSDFEFIKTAKEKDFLKDKEAVVEIDGEIKTVKCVKINDDCTLQILVDNNYKNVYYGEINFK